MRVEVLEYFLTDDTVGMWKIMKIHVTWSKRLIGSLKKKYKITEYNIWLPYLVAYIGK